MILIDRPLWAGPRAGSFFPLRMSRFAFRIVSADELSSLRASGVFESSLDARDGFIHMAPINALPDTLRLYYPNRADVCLLRVDLTAASLSSPPRRVQWDTVASRGIDFPHIYGGPLPLDAVQRVWGPLVLDEAGNHVLPPKEELEGTAAGR